MVLLTNRSPSAEQQIRPRRRRPKTARALWAAVAASAVGALFIAASQANDVVLYNHSPSMPIGLFMRTEAPIERGAIVTVRARDVAGEHARARGFAEDRDRFIKRVAATHGDTVCAEGTQISLNGVVAVHREVRDSAGQVLPSWFGCRTLERDEVLLLGDNVDSFDGRYWGVVSASLIEGVWRPLLVNAD